MSDVEKEKDRQQLVEQAREVYRWVQRNGTPADAAVIYCLLLEFGVLRTTLESANAELTRLRAVEEAAKALENAAVYAYDGWNYKLTPPDTLLDLMVKLEEKAGELHAALYPEATNG